MSRFVVCSAAYLGDVAPFIPVAQRLAARGHEVTFLAPEGFRSVLEGRGFAYAPYALDFSSSGMHADPHHERLMKHPYRNAARLGRYWMGKGFADDPTAAQQSLVDAFDGADVVVTHPTFGAVAMPIAEAMGIPVAVGHLFPMMVPTMRWSPPIGPTSPNLGRTANRLLWRMVLGGSGPIFHDRPINDLRRGLGLPTLRGNAGRAWLAGDQTVMLVSRAYYGDGADDWPAVTWGGFSLWDGGASVDEEVDAFMGDGADPPVLVTLGTSAASGAGPQFARIAADLDARDLRSLLLVGDANNLDAVRDRAGAFTFAPIVPLLPRCRVAVVSGALGGVAAALHAGVPIVVVPQLFDQIWHARRVQDLGLGFHARKAKDVGPAVAEIVADPSYAERSAAFARELADEDGAGVLADAAASLL